jgi:hypothetical protein
MGVDLASGGWRTVAASVVGTSHVGVGQPCADACVVRILGPRRNRLLLAVAADGAGASERSAEGARLACSAIVERAETRGSTGLGDFGRDEAVGWLEAARARIAEAASAEKLDARRFSCTLLVALVDARRAVFLQIGDGVIVYRGPGDSYVPAFWPQTGEYANTTWFLTDDDFVERLQTTDADAVHELALLTDGLQALALRFRTREVHGPFFQPMFERLRQEPAGEAGGLLTELQAFLDSPPVNQRTDDDKTLVLATRLAARPAGRQSRKGGRR